MIRAVSGNVHGRVQGVGFRYATIRQAERIGVSGWVSNRADGTVAFFVQGTAEGVELMLRFLRVGPSAARVDRLELQESTPDASVGRFTLR